MEQTERKFIIKAIWDYDFVMTEIAPMIEDNIKNKHLRHIAQKITTFIRGGQLEYAEELLWCWSKREISMDTCKDAIKAIEEELKEGE